MKIRRTLEHILVGTTIVATTVDGAYAGSFQQLEALYSSKASCVEISEVEMTLNNVEIKKAHIYDATGKYPIYVVGYIPTSDKDKIKKAQAIERGEEDHVFKQMVDDLNETSLKHGFRILSPEKQKEIAEKFKKIVIYYNTHDTLPPLHFPKKVYDEYGGQLIPPEDENLVTEVTQNVKEIKTISIKEAKNKNLFLLLGEKEDIAYFTEINSLSLSKSRSAILVYTPLHGVGSTSCFKLLEKAGFNITSDPKTSNQSGKFENITFNIPNPEVRESFDTTLKFAMDTNADLILNSDPDADRIGVMVKHKNKWVYLNGNEIGSILTRYSIEKWKEQGKKGGIVVKTTVTTNLATEICKANNIKLIGELPVGFKYIGEEMNKIEKEGRIDEFIFGLEESHGYIAGNYLRDKDAAIGALWLAELASELKDNNQTLVDYLDDTYSKYGYFKNYLTEIRLPGAEGMSQIRSIQDTLRSQKLTKLSKYVVNNVEDFWDRLPFLSETDKITKDVLIFHFELFENYTSIKITLRPSGTEPKAKMYFEIGSKPVNISDLPQTKEKTDALIKEFEKLFMLHCFKVLGVDFPERGFLLFWQLPLKDKLHYFEIENDIEKLISEKDIKIKNEKLNKLLEFLGNDPVEKVNKAFTAKYNAGIREYLSI